MGNATSENRKNKKRAEYVLKNIAKGQLKKRIKETDTYNDVKEVSKSSPMSLRTLGALSRILSQKSAIKAKKKFKTGNNSSITIKGEYNPVTKEKKAGIFYNKEF